MKKTNWYHIILKIITGFLFFICTILLVSSLIIIVKNKKNPDKVPDLFGYKPMIVLSGSMETEIYKGDLAIVKVVNTEILKEKDIIAFMTEDGTITTHRIVKVNDDKTFITKGDNSNTEDLTPVQSKDIEGLYISKLPGFGKVFMFIQKPLGLVVTILIILVIGLTIMYFSGSHEKINNSELKEFEEYKNQKKFKK